jgi:hypothetical protein
MGIMPNYEQLNTLEVLAHDHGVDVNLVQLRRPPTLPDEWLEAKVGGRYFTITDKGKVLK